MSVQYDVIVLGIGAMGSAACYYLARQGVHVLGLEQFGVPNEMSSHTGQSRIIRKAYFEHPDYVPLLEQAYKNWKELESETKTQIYFQTGLLYGGRPDHPVIKGVLNSAKQFAIQLDVLTSGEMEEKYPQFTIPDDYEKLFEPEAGFLLPELIIRLYADKAMHHGAEIRTNTKVIEWHKTSSGIEVTTSEGIVTANKIIITTGPWSSSFLPGYPFVLRETRQMLGWAMPKKSSSFTPGKFPCWLIADHTTPGVYYGFPALPDDRLEGPSGCKLAYHYPGATTDPDRISRASIAEDEAELVYALQSYFPNAFLPGLKLKSCMYTMTPDENFVIDFLPGYGQDVIIATGFSGHGFKFASVIGEIVCDLATRGFTKLPIRFLNAIRFG
jgi:sarcosine oxidase